MVRIRGFGEMHSPTLDDLAVAFLSAEFDEGQLFERLFGSLRNRSGQVVRRVVQSGFNQLVPNATFKRLQSIFSFVQLRFEFRIAGRGFWITDDGEFSRLR